MRRGSGKKITRAELIAARAESGAVQLVEGPWNSAFLDEAEIIPNGAHDDQIDALSGAHAAHTRSPEVGNLAGFDPPISVRKATGSHSDFDSEVVVDWPGSGDPVSLCTLVVGSQLVRPSEVQFVVPRRLMRGMGAEIEPALALSDLEDVGQPDVGRYPVGL